MCSLWLIVFFYNGFYICTGIFNTVRNQSETMRLFKTPVTSFIITDVTRSFKKTIYFVSHLKLNESFKILSTSDFYFKKLNKQAISI